MNVVVFGRSLGRAVQISLSGRAVAAIGLSLATGLCAAAFLGGYWYSAQTGSGVRIEKIQELNRELDAGHLAIARTRQHTEDTLDAMAINIGQMNARVIRLDALGRRLTEMADLGDGGFDFDSTPAMGGPEEPELRTGSAAIPEVVALMAVLGSHFHEKKQRFASAKLVRKYQRAGFPTLGTTSVKNGFVSR